MLPDVTPLLSTTFSNTAYDRNNGTVTVDASVINTSGLPLVGPVTLVTEAGANGQGQLTNGTGTTSGGEPFVTLIADGLAARPDAPSKR